MKQEYKGTWEIPVSDAPRMISFQARHDKEVADAAQAKETGVPVAKEAIVYGTGTETNGMKMLLDVRMMVMDALYREGGVSGIGGDLGMRTATAQYDFALITLTADGVRSAQVDFAVTGADIVEGRTPGSKILHFTTKAEVRRIMEDGSVGTPISTEEKHTIDLGTATAADIEPPKVSE